MTNRKNRFLTVIFACLPGAGHMFMGLMKIGVSLMASFFVVIFLSSWLDFGPLMYLVPIIWFYSFFDCINKCWASNEEFANIKDHYLFTRGDISKCDTVLKGKLKLVTGILLILIGIKLVWDIFISNLQAVIPASVYNDILTFSNLLPRFIIGLLIILIGIYLIIGKKRSVGNNV